MTEKQIFVSPGASGLSILTSIVVYLFKTSDSVGIKKEMININIGFLGHVDSGKTTLARVLSTVSSTAAFDKNPQSQERGITLDLGFSGLIIHTPEHLQTSTTAKQIQLTFVDCPGHASLIRTIIGGAQIIDLMILVIDAQKGVQTQTAECILIGEILQKKLIVVVNKIDMIEEKQREPYLNKLVIKLRKTFSKTAFQDVPIFCISALTQINFETFLIGLKGHLYIPQRDFTRPLLMYVDHCFPIKGQGTVCTGTVIQGRLSVNDTIELPSIKEQRKIKSIQMFKRPVQTAGMGDRIGVCVTQFSSKKLERGVISQPGYISCIYAAVVPFNRINYYKLPIKSKSKFHVTIGHETVMAKVVLLRDNVLGSQFDLGKEYEYLDELTSDDNLESTCFVLLEFESPILATADSLLIASKLDLDINVSMCRLAFWGSIVWLTHSPTYASDVLPNFKIYRNKQKLGTIQRVVNEQQVIVQNLFKKEGNRDMYVGKQVELSTGEIGRIDSTFGQTSKVKIYFQDGLTTDTFSLLKSKPNSVSVVLKFKKYIFNKGLGIIQ